MIKYFKQLLSAIKDIAETNKKIERHLNALQDTVQYNSMGHGSRRYIATGHWNDKS